MATETETLDPATKPAKRAGGGFPVMYSGVLPISNEAHRSHRITMNNQALAKASTIHLIPAVIDEFGPAAPYLPIMFVPTVAGPSPVFVCSLASGRNAFVSDDGRWTRGYVPAYLRRYPFILGNTDAEDPILCIDSGFEDFTDGDDGQLLFNEDGGQSDYLQGIIRLSSDYALSARRTEEAMKRVADLDLLRTVGIEGRNAEGGKVSLQGMAGIDFQRLEALSDQEYLSLREGGLLEALYAHRVSMSSLGALQAGA
ncbi:SapC family protein [Pseudoprimorskyibacter insulae]|uniref:SapC family protein n=1 Tax=Pseudoprimorskyibacter insulae TaxID=1695997 RepID=A0A2R8AW93_9RHOB|nr:SapC family protein [Pseudoprimorskyibacter insulae]SPF80290.1 hypothetical protein PRI8871_02093 [Pseudoprimorskyibacter insulae]